MDDLAPGSFKRLLQFCAIAVMGAIVLISNKLVQYPVNVNFLGLDLSNVLTWGAFTYPICFLVTDTTNRIFGIRIATTIVSFGFVFGVFLSLSSAIIMTLNSPLNEDHSLWFTAVNDPNALMMFRTSLASGSAFLISQILNIRIFDVYRKLIWWKAPAFSSLAGSFIDTLLFFCLAFVGTGLPWMTWAIGDFACKLIMIGILLYPFKFLMNSYTFYHNV